MSGRATPQELLGSGRYLRLIREGHWEFAQRTHSADAVMIAALTSDDRVILVEQYRVPMHARVLEFPAGLVGDDPRHVGEPLEETARRELLEETGYEASSMTPVFTGACSAGLSDEMVTFFVATGLSRRTKGGGVDGEQIQVHEVPWSDFPGWLRARMKQGVRADARLFTGIYWLSQMRAQRS